MWEIGVMFLPPRKREILELGVDFGSAHIGKVKSDYTSNDAILVVENIREDWGQVLKYKGHFENLGAYLVGEFGGSYKLYCSGRLTELHINALRDLGFSCYRKQHTN